MSYLYDPYTFQPYCSSLILSGFRHATSSSTSSSSSSSSSSSPSPSWQRIHYLKTLMLADGYGLAALAVGRTTSLMHSLVVTTGPARWTWGLRFILQSYKVLTCNCGPSSHCICIVSPILLLYWICHQKMHAPHSKKKTRNP